MLFKITSSEGVNIHETPSLHPTRIIAHTKLWFEYCASISPDESMDGNGIENDAMCCARAVEFAQNMFWLMISIANFTCGLADFIYVVVINVMRGNRQTHNDGSSVSLKCF